MHRLFQSGAVALALALAATASSADTRQLAASAGVSPAEASGLTLDQIARAKFNADAGADGEIAVVAPRGSSGPSARSQLIAGSGLTAEEAAGMTLTQIAVAKRNGEVRQDERTMVVSARNFPAASRGRSQLVAAAGLDADGARNVTLQELYVAKINREGDRDAQIGAH